MIIVSDTSPLVCLLHLNQINLLKDLFANVIIPTAVFNELVKAKIISENFLQSKILLLAKEKSLINEVKPLIERLQTEINFRINNNLLQKILIEANEL